MSFKQISDLLDIPVEQLEFLNPIYKLKVIPFESEFVSKVDPKSRQCRFYIRVRFFTIAQKVAYHLGFFGRNFVDKSFQKSPSLVTLAVLGGRASWDRPF